MRPPGPWFKSWSEARAQQDLRAKLAWHYGELRADRIIMGQDPATEADLACWRSITRNAVDWNRRA